MALSFGVSVFLNEMRFLCRCTGDSCEGKGTGALQGAPSQGWGGDWAVALWQMTVAPVEALEVGRRPSESPVWTELGPLQSTVTSGRWSCPLTDSPVRGGLETVSAEAAAVTGGTQPHSGGQSTWPHGT